MLYWNRALYGKRELVLQSVLRTDRVGSDHFVKRLGRLRIRTHLVAEKVELTPRCVLCYPSLEILVGDDSFELRKMFGTEFGV